MKESSGSRKILNQVSEDSGDPMLLVTNVRSLNGKAQKQPQRESKTVANIIMAETAMLEPDFSSESEIEDESNHSDEERKSKAKNMPMMPIKLGTKKYGCPICSKIMTWPSDMKKHILIHTGEKPFTCDTCGKSFSQKNHYKEHVLAHNGAFSCNICGKSLQQKRCLRYHLKYVHGNF